MACGCFVSEFRVVLLLGSKLVLSLNRRNCSWLHRCCAVVVCCKACSLQITCNQISFASSKLFQLLGWICIEIWMWLAGNEKIYLLLTVNNQIKWSYIVHGKQKVSVRSQRLFGVPGWTSLTACKIYIRRDICGILSKVWPHTFSQTLIFISLLLIIFELILL